MADLLYTWQNVNVIISRKYTCWYCGNSLASDKGWQGVVAAGVFGHVCICHYCSRPTFIDHANEQHPGAVFGNVVTDIPDKNVEDLYNEARNCVSAGAHTAAVLACRKLLMHIAVSKGAPENQAFVTYVEYLADKHYIPPDAKEWVDHIREKGNEANHEIAIMSRADATELVTFCEMLLKVVFQFPATVKKKTKPTP